MEANFDLSFTNPSLHVFLVTCIEQFTKTQKKTIKKKNYIEKRNKMIKMVLWVKNKQKIEIFTVVESLRTLQSFLAH